ncbi:MAG: alpha/beta hydrolase [Isosphaeraceae bacterium]
MKRIALALLAVTWSGMPCRAQSVNERLFEPGRSTSGGVLVNCTGGKPGPWAIDPGRPTVAVVHGINIFHPFWHYALGERYAEAIGPGENVLAWDWNARTLTGFRPSVIDKHAVEQGERLGSALLQAGLSPPSIRLIGQSEGCLVATSAARTIRDRTGQTVRSLTLIDPARGQHGQLFEELGASSVASKVEHYWIEGPSGFGKAAAHPGIEDRKLDQQTGVRGYLRPSRLDHFNAVRWHLNQVRP